MGAGRGEGVEKAAVISSLQKEIVFVKSRYLATSYVTSEVFCLNVEDTQERKNREAVGFSPAQEENCSLAHVRTFSTKLEIPAAEWGGDRGVGGKPAILARRNVCW